MSVDLEDGIGHALIVGGGGGGGGAHGFVLQTQPCLRHPDGVGQDQRAEAGSTGTGQVIRVAKDDSGVPFVVEALDRVVAVKSKQE